MLIPTVFAVWRLSRLLFVALVVAFVALVVSQAAQAGQQFIFTGACEARQWMGSTTWGVEPKALPCADVHAVIEVPDSYVPGEALFLEPGVPDGFLRLVDELTGDFESAFLDGAYIVLPAGTGPGSIQGGFGCCTFTVNADGKWHFQAEANRPDYEGDGYEGYEWRGAGGIFRKVDAAQSPAQVPSPATWLLLLTLVPVALKRRPSGQCTA